MKFDPNLEGVVVEKLLSNKNLYNDFVYTSLFDAVHALKKRWKDEHLSRIVDAYLNNDYPAPLKKSYKAVLFRQIATPNFESRRFIEFIQNIGMEPMLLEYLDDKFTTNNAIKRSLGKIRFKKIVGSKNSVRYEFRTVIDFNASCHQKLKEVKTIWGESLPDFHHELLEIAYPNASKYLYDGSEWFQRGGKNAKEYYSRYIALFVKNGILFENFVPEAEELQFIKEVFLPSFIHIWKTIGVKPLIVPLLPLDNHSDILWDAHPIETLSCLESKM